MKTFPANKRTHSPRTGSPQRGNTSCTDAAGGDSISPTTPFCLCSDSGRGMAATAWEGTARKPVFVNAARKPGGVNSGDHKSRVTAGETAQISSGVSALEGRRVFHSDHTMREALIGPAGNFHILPTGSAAVRQHLLTRCSNASKTAQTTRPGRSSI